jgi:small subunit ribosomal protein S4
MSRFREPRLKKMRALGTVLPGLGAHDLERRPYPPGQHGQGRKKVSEYGMRLREKQKLIFNYGVSEKQLRAVMTAARKLPGVTGERMLELLERRLDNAVFRAGYARSIPAARQLVTHGHIRINGRKVDKPASLVKAGQTITISDKARANVHVLEALKDPIVGRPEWLEVDEESATTRVTALPTSESVPFLIAVQFVVEHYAQSL